MKSINNNAPVKCSKTILIDSGKEKVWSLLTDINQWATWQREIKKPLFNGNLVVGNTFTWKTGGAKIISTLHTVNPSEQFGWTGKTFGMFAIHNWTFTDKEGRTQVRVDESMEGFFAKLFKKSFNKNLEKGMQTWLDLLKTACERKA